jgi:hypothetical protein
MNKENRQNTLATFNKLWDGDGLNRTLGGEGNYKLHGRRMAAHLMAQPRVAAGLLGDAMAEDTGLLARFLVCDPESTMGGRFSHLVRDGSVAIAQHNARLREICDTPLPMDPDSGALKPRKLPLSSDAREILTAFADAIEAELRPGGKLSTLTGTASKIGEQACRLAGVLTLWQNLYAAEVSAQTAAHAAELAQFYLGEAKRIGEVGGVSEETEMAEKLRLWLLENWKHPDIVQSEVVQLGPNQIRESKKAAMAIAMLEKHGWLVRLPEGAVVRGKARKSAFQIVRPHNVL